MGFGSGLTNPALLFMLVKAIWFSLIHAIKQRQQPYFRCLIFYKKKIRTKIQKISREEIVTSSYHFTSQFSRAPTIFVRQTYELKVEEEGGFFDIHMTLTLDNNHNIKKTSTNYNYNFLRWHLWLLIFSLAFLFKCNVQNIMK